MLLGMAKASEQGGKPHVRPRESGSLRMSTMTMALDTGSEVMSIISCVHWASQVCIAAPKQ